MNQQLIQAYLTLIQALISCPDGEEWNILHHNERLLSPDFVEFMAQVAKQMKAKAKLEIAAFLYYWVEQLKYIYQPENNPQTSDNYPQQAYIDLIQELLDCPEGREADVLTAHQDLVDSRLVYMLKQFAQQMLERGEKETANYFNNLAMEIHQLLVRQANIIKPKPESGQIEDSLNGHYPNRSSDLNDFKKPYQNYTENQAEFPFPVYRENLDAKSLETNLPKQEIEFDRSLIPDLGQESHQAPLENQPNTFSQQSETLLTFELEEKLNHINQSLQRLEQILIARSQPLNPLWYMDILERAQACDWSLSSEEVESLIGVKPKCEAGQDSFQRGCWVFKKIGKTGL